MQTPPTTSPLPIVRYPAPGLRSVCSPVEQFGGDIEKVALEMLELMRQSNGVGLAAPQVGLAVRLFVCNHTGEPGDNMICINPELSALDGAERSEEGCLSIPDVHVTVQRATRAHLTARDVHGDTFERDGEGLLARVWQHETDHLDGRLILDYMDESDAIANRRMLKQLEAEYKKSR